MSEVTRQATAVEINPATARLLGGAMFVVRCHPASPAHKAGIRSGWMLVEAGKSAPTKAVVDAAMRNGAAHYLFNDPSDGRFYRLEGGPWPFGIVLAPCPTPAYLKELRKGTDYEPLLKYAQEGLYGALADFGPALEDYLARDLRGLVDVVLGRKASRETLALNNEYPYLLLLSFAHLGAGHAEDAEFFVRACVQARYRTKQVSHSTVIQALECLIMSVLHERAGEMDKAREMIDVAYRLAPDVTEIGRQHARLAGVDFVPFEHPQVGKSFPVAYDLPARDPIGEIKTHVERITLKSALDQTEPDEFVAIFVMGPYRSNYYYNLDLVRLALVAHAHPKLIQEVHVIVSSCEQALDAWHRQWAEGLARDLKLPFAILHDEHGTISPHFDVAGYPVRLLLDRSGKILSMADLMDEEGIWQAASRLPAVTQPPAS